MYPYNQDQDVCHNQVTIKKHLNSYTSVIFIEVELNFDVVIAESHSRHIIWVWHLVILYKIMLDVVLKGWPKWLEVSYFSKQEDRKQKCCHVLGFLIVTNNKNSNKCVDYKKIL